MCGSRAKAWPWPCLLLPVVVCSVFFFSIHIHAASIDNVQTAYKRHTNYSIEREEEEEGGRRGWGWCWGFAPPHSISIPATAIFHPVFMFEYVCSFWFNVNIRHGRRRKNVELISFFKQGLFTLAHKRECHIVSFIIIFFFRFFLLNGFYQNHKDLKIWRCETEVTFSGLFFYLFTKFDGQHFC